MTKYVLALLAVLFVTLWFQSWKVDSLQAEVTAVKAANVVTAAALDELERRNKETEAVLSKWRSQALASRSDKEKRRAKATATISNSKQSAAPLDDDLARLLCEPAATGARDYCQATGGTDPPLRQAADH